MAAQLLDFYELVKREYGPAGRMKLAMLTLISSAQAEKEADSPENIQKFEKALAHIRSELKK